MAIDHSKVKLGKGQVVKDPRGLHLAKYLRTLYSPAKLNWGAASGIPAAGWGMMDNDTVGDCTCACAGHLIKEWSTLAGKPFTPTDTEILSAYEAISGYTPSDPNTDVGATCLSVLQYWNATGFGGHKLYSYVDVNHKDTAHVKAAVYLFGGIYVGIQLPASAQNQSGAGECWSVPSTGIRGNGAPGSWGGHCIPVVGYNDKTLAIITWGALQYMTWGFFNLYVDEAWAPLSRDWIEANGEAPDKLNLAQLNADLQLVIN